MRQILVARFGGSRCFQQVKEKSLKLRTRKGNNGLRSVTMSGVADEPKPDLAGIVTNHLYTKICDRFVGKS